MVNKKLELYIPPPYIFNVRNSVHLINDLLEILYDQDLKIASFDITNTYCNVPTTDKGPTNASSIYVLPHYIVYLAFKKNWTCLVTAPKNLHDF
jgi:hypothetical protein